MREPASLYSKLRRTQNTRQYLQVLITSRVDVLVLAMLLMLVSRAASLALPALSKPLIDHVITRGEHALLPVIIAEASFAVLTQVIASYLLAILLTRSGERLLTDLRKQLHRHILNMSISFHDNNKSASLASRVISDVEVLDNLTGTGLIDLGGAVVSAFFGLIVLFRISAPITFVSCAFLGGFAFLANRRIRVMKVMYEERATLRANVIGRLSEAFAGIRSIKVYNAEIEEENLFSQGVDELLRNFYEVVGTQSLLNAASALVVGAVGVCVMLMGANECVSGRMTAGTYVMYTLYIGYMTSPLVQIVALCTQMTSALASLSRTHNLLSSEGESDECTRTHKHAEEKGYVTFDNVIFGYSATKTVLHGISFEAPPGSVTALVGPSGSGKSTIVSLLCGFYTPQGGRILIDQADISITKLSTLRRQLGVVFQDNFLFDGTLRENIMFSKPQASEADFLTACQQAFVDEVANHFGEGYDTVIGERGIRLSGGQKQRVAIARALLADPQILILDEATSSLDSLSEALIQAAIENLIVGRTTIVIAHRLSTIRAADQILVLEAGSIVERGSHTQLINRSGRYRKFWDRQVAQDYAADSSLH